MYGDDDECVQDDGESDSVGYYNDDNNDNDGGDDDDKGGGWGGNDGIAVVIVIVEKQNTIGTDLQTSCSTTLIRLTTRPHDSNQINNVDEETP